MLVSISFYGALKNFILNIAAKLLVLGGRLNGGMCMYRKSLHKLIMSTSVL